MADLDGLRKRLDIGDPSALHQLANDVQHIAFTLAVVFEALKMPDNAVSMRNIEERWK